MITNIYWGCETTGDVGELHAGEERPHQCLKIYYNKLALYCHVYPQLTSNVQQQESGTHSVVSTQQVLPDNKSRCILLRPVLDYLQT